MLTSLIVFFIYFFVGGFAMQKGQDIAAKKDADKEDKK